MSDYSAAFAEHLARECTTLCHCWLVTRRDGTAFGFTDHDRALTVDGRSYEPQSGFAQSEARASLGMAIDTADIEGALSSAELKEEEIADGLFDGASVETLLVNWRDPTVFAPIRKAAVGKITRADGRFLAELESVAASLDRPNGRYLRRSCDAELGDHRCQVDLSGAGFNGAGTVAAITAPRSIVVGGLEGFEPGWFAFGKLTWQSGELAGRTAVLADHRATMSGVVLVLPADARMPQPGDAFSVVAGCDKSFATCKAKFANSVNFRGFPHLPGNDAAYAYVTEGVLFDGKALVE
jgi:uncharacterized phage protein (TIGR02218 family)